ncbi:MAG: hypothetical protein WAV00_00865, partial [Nocardioides sp.]
MSISGHHHNEGPAAVLAQVRARVAELAQTLWAAQPDGEVVDVVGQVQRAKAALAAVEADAVAEADARDVAKKVLHFGSTGDWLTHAGGLRRGEGRRLVRRAVAVTGALGRTRARMVAGTVSAEQADVIVRAVADLPGWRRIYAGGRRRPWSATRAGSTPPTSPAPAATCWRWSTPTASTPSSRPDWTGRTGPRTPTGT